MGNSAVRHAMQTRGGVSRLYIAAQIFEHKKIQFQAEILVMKDSAGNPMAMAKDKDGITMP